MRVFLYSVSRVVRHTSASALSEISVVRNGVPGKRSFETERKRAAVPSYIGGTGTGALYVFEGTARGRESLFFFYSQFYSNLVRIGSESTRGSMRLFSLASFILSTRQNISLLRQM